MVLVLNQSVLEHRAFVNLIHSPHRLYVRFQLMDLDHNHIADISHRFVDGQVDYDADAEVVSTASMEFWDPHSTMHIDSGSPSDGAMFMDRMIRAIYCIGNPDGTKWYTCPVFTGPMTKVDRNEQYIDIELSGKEYLMYSSVWNAHTYKKGKSITDVMKDIANDYGEGKTNIPNKKKTLVKQFALGRESVPWTAMKTLAKALGMQLFYDNRGVLNLKERPRHVKFTFDEKMMTSFPQIGFSTDNLINAVKVVGAKPKGKGKKKVKFVARAKRSHPLSPWRLGRTVGGDLKPRYYMAVIEDEKLKTKKDCKAVAMNRLEQGLIESVEASWDGMVVPFLEMNDNIRLKTETFACTVRLRKASFSLSAPGLASYGYNRNLKPARKKIRRHKK